MVKRLLIQCPQSLLTDYAARNCDMEQLGSDTYLKLMLLPANYKPIKTFKQLVQYVRALSAPQYRFQTYVREFEVKADGRAYLFDIV